MRRRPSDWKVIATAQDKLAQDKSAQDAAPNTRTRSTADASNDAKATNEGAGDRKSGATQTLSQGTGIVSSISSREIFSRDRAAPCFGRRVSYGDNPRLALFAPPRWPGGGGRSARRSAKS